jgi:hypothetical protein
VATASLHGVTVGVPDGWVDDSVLRYMSPSDESDPVVSHSFTQNVVVTSHAVPDSVPMAKVFEAPNRAAKSTTNDFEVLAGGECLYLGQPAVFQDVSFSDPRVNTVLCQRQLALKAENGLVVILTMTSDKKRFKKAAAEFPVEAAAPKKR